ncbi:hypothetical protein [Flavobacterium poyangense]|uniref:hypothetical protein n=1 Tax=Flavobacterium poyangense TaxID=2204302 RepID=UPI00141F33C5|nr:hypothetical protein [Flavobacterium sp. JXAS1]
MNKFFVVFLICFLLSNCNKAGNKNGNTPYIISQKTHIINGDTVLSPPPIPGWLVYGSDTFIINSDSTAYYFQNNEIGFICGTPNADTIPHFSDLHPRDLITVSNKNIYDFIKLNYSNDFRNGTFIASQSDTLNSKMFFDLYKSLNFFKRNRDFIAIRRTTQEEDTVLKYKKNNNHYDPEDIKWDQNRITFPFIKPKLNHSN